MFLRNRDVITGLVAQVLQYGAAFALLPFIVTRISKEQVSIWFIFVTIQSLVILADFGFQPSISRAFSAAYGGASHLLRQGLSTSMGEQPSLALVNEIYRASRKLYLALAVLVLLILLTLGSFYLLSLADRAAMTPRSLMLAWLPFSLSVAANLYLLWAAPLLIGAGLVHQSYYFTIVTKGSFTALGILFLLLDGGLVGLALANLCSIIIGMAVLFYLIRPLVKPLHEIQELIDHPPILTILWPNASKSGLVALGGFLVGRSNILLISSFLGLTASGQYALSLQVLSACVAMSQIPIIVAVPTMTRLRVQEQRDLLRQQYVTRHLVQLAIFSVTVIAFNVVGPHLLTAIGSRIGILPQPALAMLSVVLLLEANHTNAAIGLATNNHVPFVWSALYSGIAVVLLSFLSMKLGMGIIGAITAQGVVQIVYNNWKWPLEIWKDLRA